ncbi:MAG TPA: DUF1178 family protein, partial [Acetobacteraceae bacterium]|nr:DUF1178 family protein [Acetobacteraceae bacterium]
ADHGFDGWFKDSAAFEAQAERGLVACPECGDSRVNRALMAPAIGRKRATVDQTGAPEPPPAPVPIQEKAAAVMPDQVRAVLQRIRAEIERTSDYVGPEFAEEARRIHRGESEKRSIYGESTLEQAEALAEEGIEVARIPWVPRADG